MNPVSRRRFLQASGALVVSAAIAPPAAVEAQSAANEGPALASRSVPARGAAPAPGELDSWIAILADGSVQAFFGKMDMGQGLEVAIAQIVAEELDVAVEQVTVIMGDTALTCNQGGASGSTGVTLGGRPLRNAAAEARRILLDAAAGQLGVPGERLRIDAGVVTVREDAARRVSYGELIGGRHFESPVEWNQATGNAMDVKGRATPKLPADYRVVGRSVPRRDLAGKIYGTRDFVTDVRVPGMLHARMIRPPQAGRRIGRVDETSIAAFTGAQVVREGEFLAVVASQEWTAVRAARDLRVDWQPGEDVGAWPGHEGLHAHLRAAPVLRREEPSRHGDVDAAFAAAARVIEAEYEWPLQSHASIGPACAVADVRADGATVWTGSQKPHSVRDGVAQLLGLSPDAVRSIWVMGPGSYGRNDAGDAALDAAWLSKRLGRPVRVQGMRADGTAWDPKGPAVLSRVRAALDGSGAVTAFDSTARGLSRVNVSFNEADPRDALAGMALGLPLNAGVGLGIPAESYGFGAKRHAWEVVAPLLARSSPLRTSHLRDPLGPEVHFGSEQFIDELAAATGADPVAFRLRYLTAPRDIAVVQAAAARSGWQARSSPALQSGGRGLRRGRGIAYAQRGETVVAVVADIEVDPRSGRIRARRVTVAHDCGLVVNPRGLEQTIEGNVVHGLSRVLFEEVRFDADTVLSVDWASYPILEMRDAPEAIDIVLLDPTHAPPSGAGEPTIRCVPAAVANAFFDATGVRLRRAPLTAARVQAALARRDG